MKEKLARVAGKLFRGELLVVKCVVLFLLTAGLVQAAEQKTLSGHVPAVVSRLHLQPLGTLTNSARLNLAIGLPLRNQETLARLLEQIYDPASTNYHHYLTPEQFTEMFGPSEQDYQAVIAFAKTNGLVVTGTHSNRVLVDVSGAVTDIQKAFHMTMKVYQHPTENRTFYAPDVEPSVPSTLPVLHVSGFDNYALPHPNLELTPLDQVTNVIPNGGSGPQGLYMGNDFRNAYVPGVSLNGSAQVVGLLEFDGYYPNDITLYLSRAGLPNVPLQIVSVDGGVSTPGSGNTEVALDIDMVIAMAPGLSKVVVYEAPNPSPWVDILNRMAADSSIKQFSCSWGGGSPDPTSEQVFEQMAAQGQSFFNASGDSDAFTGAIGFPSESTNITQVGGTVLTMNGSGVSYSSETVWNRVHQVPPQDGVGSCGGISTYYTIPSWQLGISMTANKGSTTMRNIPDVALTAENIYIFSDDGASGEVGGTSCAAPLWAAFTALVNQQSVASGHSSVGFINPAIYTTGKGSGYTNAFHDTKTGDNYWSGSPTHFPAVAGYDLCTGWGTPNGAGLINALAPLSRNGFLTVSVNPPSSSALVSSTAQPIYVTVNDVYAVTNATVTAVVTNSLGTVANLTFLDNGVAPDATALDGIYSATLSVPASTNSLTMTVVATAANEIGVTNVFYYSVIQRPANDNFTNATKVTITPASYSANNRFATIETNEPSHDGDTSVAASLWWSWMPTTSTNVFIDTVGSEINAILAVYTGDALTNLQQVVATNGSLAQYRPAQVSFNAQAGTTYHIVVASVNSNSVGSLDLHITPGGQPDITAPVVHITNLLSGLTVESPIITVAGTASDPGPNASGVSQVFVTVNGRSLTAMGTTNWTTPVSLQPNLNIIQVSAVDEAGNFSSPVTVEVNYLVLGPPNDFFVNAIQLSGASGTVSAENTNATREVGEPDITGNPGGKSLWWYFVPSSDGVLNLQTATNTFDTLLGLYTGANVASLTTIADNDDATNGAPSGFSEITQAVRAGQTNYVAVDGYNGASGTFSLIYSFVTEPVYRLTVNNTPGGTVQLETTNGLGGVVILPGESGNFASNSTVTLIPVPNASSQFYSWSGSVVSSDNPLTVVMASDKTITANFTNRVFTDGFESGNLSHLPWTTATTNGWFVQTNVVCVGQYAAQSGAIGDSQSSSLILTFFATNNGTGSFDYKVSSEENCDPLNFYVNGILLQQWSGEVGWATYTFPLTAGTNTLEWSYVKDLTISEGLDAAFIDDVSLPDDVAFPVPLIDSSSPAKLQLQSQTDGKFFINLTGQDGQQYVVQTSTDMVNWQNISTNFATGGSIRILLPSNGTNQVQFYRAIVPLILENPDSRVN